MLWQVVNTGSIEKSQPSRKFCYGFCYDFSTMTPHKYLILLIYNFDMTDCLSAIKIHCDFGN